MAVSLQIPSNNIHHLFIYLFFLLKLITLFLLDFSKLIKTLNRTTTINSTHIIIFLDAIKKTLINPKSHSTVILLRLDYLY